MRRLAAALVLVALTASCAHRKPAVQPPRFGASLIFPTGSSSGSGGGLTNAELRASPVPISGTVTANAGTNLNTSALALDANLVKLTLAQGSATAAQTGPLHLCAATTAAPSYTNGNSFPCSLTLAGALRIDGSATTQPVSGTVAATQSGAWSLSANQSVNVAQINGVTPLMGNGTAGTGSQRVTIASDNTAFTVNVGAFPDNEPINNAQVNGVTILTGNGVTGTGSQRVTIASDNTAFNVNGLNPTVASATLTSVSGSASSVSCAASNASRRGVSIYNDSTALLYVAFAATSSTTAFTVRVASQGYYEMPSYPVYTGTIACIWASATGAARVTEVQ